VKAGKTFENWTTEANKLDNEAFEQCKAAVKRNGGNGNA